LTAAAIAIRILDLDASLRDRKVKGGRRNVAEHSATVQGVVRNGGSLVITGERQCRELTVVRAGAAIGREGNGIARDKTAGGAAHLEAVIFETLVLNEHVVLGYVIRVKSSDVSILVGHVFLESAETEMKCADCSRGRTTRVNKQVVADGDIGLTLVAVTGDQTANVDRGPAHHNAAALCRIRGDGVVFEKR
jgi:hypothetical protein